MIVLYQTSWSCEPVIAACHVEVAAWTTEGGLLSDDLTPQSEFHKVIRIKTLREEAIAYVVCVAAPRGTNIEFLQFEGLQSHLVVKARRLMEAIIARAYQQRLLRRPAGFHARLGAGQ